MNVWGSPLGAFEIEITDAGISSLALLPEDKPESAALGAVENDLASSLTEHMHGRPASLRLDLSSVTSSIAQLTLAKLLEIPYGEVRSYAWVAKEIRHATAIRPVASALARNPIPVLIPCHRVVRSDGHIGEFSLGGPEMKKRLLEFEGLDLQYVEGLAARGVRFMAEKETGMYHLPTCRLAPRGDEPTAMELQHREQAVSGGLDPCRRCRPI